MRFVTLNCLLMLLAVVFYEEIKANDTAATPKADLLNEMLTDTKKESTKTLTSAEEVKKEAETLFPDTSLAEMAATAVEAKLEKKQADILKKKTEVAELEKKQAAAGNGTAEAKELSKKILAALKTLNFQVLEEGEMSSKCNDYAVAVMAESDLPLAKKQKFERKKEQWSQKIKSSSSETAEIAEQFERRAKLELEDGEITPEERQLLLEDLSISDNLRVVSEEYLMDDYTRELMFLDDPAEKAKILELKQAVIEGGEKRLREDMQENEARISELKLLGENSEELQHLLMRQEEVEATVARQVEQVKENSAVAGMFITMAMESSTNEADKQKWAAKKEKVEKEKKEAESKGKMDQMRKLAEQLEDTSDEKEIQRIMYQQLNLVNGLDDNAVADKVADFEKELEIMKATQHTMMSTKGQSMKSAAKDGLRSMSGMFNETEGIMEMEYAKFGGLAGMDLQADLKMCKKFQDKGDSDMEMFLNCLNTYSIATLNVSETAELESLNLIQGVAKKQEFQFESLTEAADKVRKEAIKKLDAGDKKLGKTELKRILEESCTMYLDAFGSALEMKLGSQLFFTDYKGCVKVLRENKNVMEDVSLMQGKVDRKVEAFNSARKAVDSTLTKYFTAAEQTRIKDALKQRGLGPITKTALDERKKYIREVLPVCSEMLTVVKHGMDAAGGQKDMFAEIPDADQTMDFDRGTAEMTASEFLRSTGMSEKDMMDASSMNDEEKRMFEETMQMMKSEDSMDLTMLDPRMAMQLQAEIKEDPTMLVKFDEMGLGEMVDNMEKSSLTDTTRDALKTGEDAYKLIDSAVDMNTIQKTMDTLDSASTGDSGTLTEQMNSMMKTAGSLDGSNIDGATHQQLLDAASSLTGSLDGNNIDGATHQQLLDAASSLTGSLDGNNIDGATHQQLLDGASSLTGSLDGTNIDGATHQQLLDAASSLTGSLDGTNIDGATHQQLLDAASSLTGQTGEINLDGFQHTSP